MQIFINDNALHNLCCDEMHKKIEAQSPWFRILRRQEIIFIVKSSQWNDLSSDDLLFIFSKQNEIKYVDATDFIKEVLTDNSKVTQCSSPVFILDIPEDKAKQIQNDYGVICVSSKNLGDCPLGIDSNDSTPLIEEKGYSWLKILDDYSSLPSNSLIIIDRNLFTYDTEINDVGRDNICQIFDKILPLSFKGVYNISIITDHSTLKHEFPFKNLCNKIFKLRKKLKRLYTINIDVIGVDRAPHDEFYKETHNRRILTNYTFTTAEHGICAFSKGKSLKTQKITTSVLYSDIMRNKRDLPIKLHHYLIKFLRDFKTHCIEVSAKYPISINGKIDMLPENWNNRLLYDFEIEN